MRPVPAPVKENFDLGRGHATRDGVSGEFLVCRMWGAAQGVLVSEELLAASPIR